MHHESAADQFKWNNHYGAQVSPDVRLLPGSDQQRLEPSVGEVREATAYEQHRMYVLAVLARRCHWLDPSDREGLLHDAYALYLQKQREGQLDPRNMRPAQIRSYLTRTALNRAMDEGKRASRRRSISLEAEQGCVDPMDAGPALDEHLAASLNEARVREIVSELPERQQLVIELRFFFDRSPREVQRYLAISERVYRRDLERASRHIARRYELVREGSYCESRRSLILAYVTGIAGPTRARHARRHLQTCVTCAHWAAELYRTADDVATLPPHRATVPANTPVQCMGRFPLSA